MCWCFDVGNGADFGGDGRRRARLGRPAQRTSRKFRLSLWWCIYGLSCARVAPAERSRSCTPDSAFLAPNVLDPIAPPITAFFLSSRRDLSAVAQTPNNKIPNQPRERGRAYIFLLCTMCGFAKAPPPPCVSLCKTVHGSPFELYLPRGTMN